MSIVNHDYYYMLHNFGGPSIVHAYGQPSSYSMRNWSDGFDYYYFCIGEGKVLDHFPLHTWLPHGILTQVKYMDNFRLAIHNAHEAFDSCIWWIYKHVVERYSIPANKILFLTNSFDAKARAKKVAEEFGGLSINVEVMVDFEFAVRSRLEEPGRMELLPSTLEHKEYPKAFLNFNRRWRPHRPLFVALLAANDMLKYGHISFGESDDPFPRFPKAYEYLIDDTWDYKKIRPILEQNKESICAIPDMYLDTTDLVTNRADLDVASEAYLYNETYFSVVSETNYYMDKKGHEGTRFLSEKVFKPIIYKHPFLVVSTPGIIKALHSIGYQTFSPYIDETYDTIESDEDRMLCIVDEVYRLSTLNKKGLRRFINGVKEITEYNFRQIMTKRTFTDGIYGSIDD